MFYIAQLIRPGLPQIVFILSDQDSKVSLVLSHCAMLLSLALT
jgi:hypothetical protein